MLSVITTANLQGRMSLDFFGPFTAPYPGQGQGHRVHADAPFVAAFERWIRRRRRGVHGCPQRWPMDTRAVLSACGEIHRSCDEVDERRRRRREP
jgi:hypothetical protein